MNPKLLTIRSKKIGVCLADTRMKARKSIEDTAHHLGITATEYAAFEKGATTPSLPQLELLGVFFNVPVDHLINWQPEPEETSRPDPAVLGKIVKLREHVIAAIVSKTRQQKQISSEALADECGITTGELNSYEKAEKPIPYPVLEAMSKFLGLELTALYSSHGPLKKKSVQTEQEEPQQKQLDLPPELYDFINKPINRPYVELAHKLSEMSVDRLRAVAESLLEITY